MKLLISFFLVLSLTLSSLPTLGSQVPGSWRSVGTNNLFVIGNADAETLQQVAVWLEFFHGAFARLVSRSAFDPSVPTTVMVFRDEASFIPFKPLYQGRPANVAGYFQSGEDVNYIAISLDPAERVPYDTAFHEYVHLHLKDSLPGAPLWLNEGLAEFYGALQFARGEALLGAAILPYVYFLRSSELLPLTTLFAIDGRSPHYNEQDKSGIFYGQSWALVHYLMLGADGARQQQFRQFLQQISQGETSEKAIERAFGTSLDRIEKEFEAYVRRGEFPAQRVASAVNPQAYAAYTATQRSALSEGETNYYLGDLLLHINRLNDAESYFKQAIAAEPGFIPTYASLGQLYAHQKRYAEAKKYLQRATITSQNHQIHYLYAYVLSREGISASGEINEYSRIGFRAIQKYDKTLELWGCSVIAILANTYFSGAGLMDIGLQSGGLTLQQSFEIESICCETLRRNFSHEVVQCDITKKLVHSENECHVMVATYPCTKYSPIGDIHGVRTGDDLFLHFFRHVAIRRPELYVVENVPGMKKFPVVMEAMTKLPDYYVHVACPVKSSTWLPQKRDRLIIIGSRRNFAWREPTAKRAVTLAEILEPNPTPHIPDYVGRRLAGKYRDRPIVSDPVRGDIAPTCVAHYAKDLSTRLVADQRFPHGARPYTVREYARLQGVPDTFTFAGSYNDAYRMIGNGVSVPVGEWIGSEITRYFQ